MLEEQPWKWKQIAPPKHSIPYTIIWSHNLELQELWMNITMKSTLLYSSLHMPLERVRGDPLPQPIIIIIIIIDLLVTSDQHMST